MRLLQIGLQNAACVVVASYLFIWVPVTSVSEYLELCITPEGREGACLTYSECFIKEPTDTLYDLCYWRGRSAFLCCTKQYPASENIHRPPREHTLITQGTVPVSILGPVKSFLSALLQPFLQSVMESQQADVTSATTSFISKEENQTLKLADTQLTSATFSGISHFHPQTPKPQRFQNGKPNGQFMQNSGLLIVHSVPSNDRPVENINPMSMSSSIPIATEVPIAPTPPKFFWWIASMVSRQIASTTERPVTEPFTQAKGTRWPASVALQQTTFPEETSTTAQIRSTRKTPTSVESDIYKVSCGIRPHLGHVDGNRPQIEAYVLGGEVAGRRRWPWMVSIHLERYSNTSRFLCGGSLITTRHILTAAHCFDSAMKEAAGYTAVLGSNRRDGGSTHPSSAVRRIEIVNIHIHETYMEKFHYHDIAILTLGEEVKRMETIRPVCLPSSHEARELKSGTNAVVMGWGHTSYGGLSSEELLDAAVQILPLSRCQQSYAHLKSRALPNGITTDMMCAGLPGGGVDSCEGDSGGPLVVEVGKRWIQVGIVSFGFRCGLSDYPGVYTRVSAYMSWIERILSEETVLQDY